MNTLLNIYISATGSNILQLTVVAIVLDTMFGLLRAVKERKYNSNFGINGAIRKVGMIVCLLALILVDAIIHTNLIGFIPQTVRSYFDLHEVGTAEFFGVLFISYEITSILKNMTLCGLPVKKIWQTVRKFLSKYTDELPSE